MIRKPMLLALTFLLIPLATASCGNDPLSSSEYIELQEALDASAAETAELKAEVDALDAAAADMPPIVAEFKAAYESRELDRIRALYTEDGIFMTTDDAFQMYYGDQTMFGELGLDGNEFVRRASIHAGEMLISHAASNGENAVSFVWEWQDFASGTATFHLRDGRIAVAMLTVTQVELEPATTE